MNSIPAQSVNRLSTSAALQKRMIVAAYCDGWISRTFAQALIDALDLRGA